MMNQLPPEMPFLTNDQVDLLKRTSLLEFGEDDKLTFIEICQRTHLDPFTGQIYPTKRSKTVYEQGIETRITTLVPVTSYEGLIWVAERTQNYDGNEIAWAADEPGPDGEPIWRKAWLPSRGYPSLARGIVYHKKHKYPEVAIAEWGAYAAYKRDGVTLQDFWKRMPDLMLSKCALALALRRAFPNQLGAIYIKEELDRSDTEAEPKTEPLKNVANVIPIRITAPDEEEKALREEAKKIPPRTEPAAAQQPPQPDGAAPPSAPSPPVPAAVGETEAGSPEPATQPDPNWWREHVITGIKDDRFKGRKVSELSQIELYKLEKAWLSKVIPRWDEANEDQKADAEALKSALAEAKA